MAKTNIPSYPNRVVKKGDKDKSIVKAIQKQLNAKGCGPIEEDGDFGTKTYNSVRLFQARFLDQNNVPLKIDGQVGPLTWAILFGEELKPIPKSTTTSLLQKVLDIAATQDGVRERPLGSNSGPEVDKYLASVGLGPGFAWCAAFVYWCFKKAASDLGQGNPVYKTAGVMNHWNSTTGKKISRLAAADNPSLIKPGSIFIISTGGGFGHTGLVERVNGGYVATIEGNTNEAGSRNGIGVFSRSRKINDINKGFIIY